MIANVYHRHTHATAHSRRSYVSRDRLCVGAQVHLIRQMRFDVEHGLMVLKECVFLDHDGRTLDSHDYLAGIARAMRESDGIMTRCDGTCAPIRLPLPPAAAQALGERGFASRDTGLVFESSRWDGIPEIDVCVGGFAHLTLAHEADGSVWRNARPCDGDCQPKRVRLEGALVRRIVAFGSSLARGRAASRSVARPDLSC